MSKDDLLKKLEQKKEFPPNLPGIWNAGDNFFFKFLSLNIGKGTDFNDKTKIIDVPVMIVEATENATLKDFEVKKGEKYSLWLSTSVLRNQFVELKPKEGEVGVVQYGGKAEGKTYHIWNVVLDREHNSEPADWTSFEV